MQPRAELRANIGQPHQVVEVAGVDFARAGHDDGRPRMPGQLLAQGTRINRGAAGQCRHGDMTFAPDAADGHRFEDAGMRRAGEHGRKRAAIALGPVARGGH